MMNNIFKKSENKAEQVNSDPATPPEEARDIEATPEVTIEDKVEKEIDYQKLVDEANDKYMRVLAEYDNFRKRSAKEKASRYNDGVGDTIEKLLPVVDNFERAMVSSALEENNAFYKGVAMILKQLQDTLSDIGVEEIKAVGEKFDANIHFAVAHVDDNNYGESEVIDLMQKGYIYKDKVIRPAMVKVAN